MVQEALADEAYGYLVDLESFETFEVEAIIVEYFVHRSIFLGPKERQHNKIPSKIT